MKVRDMLLGVAVGDAFLAGFEMESSDWVFANVDFTKYISTRAGKYAKGYSLGDYTDDTEMSIGLINTIMDEREFSEELLLEKWKEEYDMSKKARGGIPRAGHGGIKHFFEGNSSLEQIRKSQSLRKYPGNAPPMRAVPLGLLSGDIDHYAKINANSTHPHPKSEAASIIVARASEYMIARECEQEHIINYCKPFIRNIDNETFLYLEKINELGPELDDEGFELICGPQPLPYPKGKDVYGLPIDAMRTAGAALHVIKHSDDAFCALRRSAYFGGDVDSLGAITVGIMGGRYGIDTLPDFMLEGLEGRERLESIAQNFQKYLKK